MTVLLVPSSRRIILPFFNRRFVSLPFFWIYSVIRLLVEFFVVFFLFLTWHLCFPSPSWVFFDILSQNPSLAPRVQQFFLHFSENSAPPSRTLYLLPLVPLLGLFCAECQNPLPGSAMSSPPPTGGRTLPLQLPRFQ